MKLLAVVAIIAVGLGVIIVTNLNNNSDAKNIIATNNTLGVLTIRGSAHESVVPDMVSLSVGVTTTNSSAKAAVDENAKIMNEIIDILKENDISSDDEISTSYYNVNPVYSSDNRCIEIYPSPEKCNIITGFRVVNTLMITTDADKDIGKLIDLVVEAGATDINGISFFPSRMLVEDIKNKLIEEAVINAKERAELTLKPLSMAIVGVKSVNVDGVYTPQPVYYALEKTQILPSEQNIHVDVEITFYIY